MIPTDLIRIIDIYANPDESEEAIALLSLVVGDLLQQIPARKRHGKTKEEYLEYRLEAAKTALRIMGVDRG